MGGGGWNREMVVGSGGVVGRRRDGGRRLSGRE
jgi:hypothetical protein